MKFNEFKKTLLEEGFHHDCEAYLDNSSLKERDEFDCLMFGLQEHYFHKQYDDMYVRIWVLVKNNEVINKHMLKL